VAFWANSALGGNSRFSCRIDSIAISVILANEINYLAIQITFFGSPRNLGKQFFKAILGLAEMRLAIAIWPQVLQSLKLCHRSSDEQIAVR
jgi:hypothetical protein